MRTLIHICLSALTSSIMAQTDSTPATQATDSVPVVNATDPLATTPSPVAVNDTDVVSIQFKVSELTVQRSGSGTLVGLELEADGLEQGRKYNIVIREADGTDLHGSAYTLEVPFSTLEGTGSKIERRTYLTLAPDALPGRDQTLALKVEVSAVEDDVVIKNAAAKTVLKVTVKPAGPELDGYNYLAYVGTNFDLVDGVQAKNLFLAVNTYLPSKSDLRIGHFISLYGNRAFTTIDSSGTVVRLSGGRPLTDTTYQLFRTESKRVTEYVADNIGAYYAPLIRIGSIKKRTVTCSLAPAAEFIWRRVLRNTTFSDDVPLDTITYAGSIGAPATFPSAYVERENRFEFKIGPGAFIAHDNDRISVHLYMNTGFSTLYIPQGRPSGLVGEVEYGRLFDWYFSGRLWITEPHSGLTLQAEIANSWFHPQPYYVVTLSKAINFKNLGNFFAPVTGRG
ncbi:MAG TPA: hypothetical protein PKE21_15530 [Flavobacteriales bacterium]|nr:hypothetical protein [Flavobacteriales bacterium]HMR28893.1 hypothetical protein [Flavobacteriales bacterium]